MSQKKPTNQASIKTNFFILLNHYINFVVPIISRKDFVQESKDTSFKNIHILNEFYLRYDWSSFDYLDEHCLLYFLKQNNPPTCEGIFTVEMGDH